MLRNTVAVALAPIASLVVANHSHLTRRSGPRLVANTQGPVRSHD